MANEQNLIPAKKGEVRNPKGKPKGTFGLRRILAEIAEDPEIDLLNLKPDDKANLKKRYGTNVKKAIAYGIITRMVTDPHFASKNIERIEGTIIEGSGHVIYLPKELPDNYDEKMNPDGTKKPSG